MVDLYAEDAVHEFPFTRPGVLPNIVVLTVRDGRIVRFRDYVNVTAVAEAAGRRPPSH
jgi:uncharacterized protein